MEAAGPETLPRPQRRRNTLPLCPLVERSGSRASIPHHLLESKNYAKLKSNNLIEAEPSELHFSGIEPGKDYVKTLKLINISSEVVNIHIIPTQTRHFQTTYTKKYRLIPGLEYKLKVDFCPDEWRYFYDCIRVHCQDEENLLIPVHAYPVIDDLHIPPLIDLSAVRLGQSVCHTIPLRCSCPIGFEFDVFVIESHKAFTILPLTGAIPASGEVEISVTFCPDRYETCRVTIKLVISQFNTRPYLCTITGSCAPPPGFGQRERKSGRGDSAAAETIRPPAQVPPQSTAIHRSNKDSGKSKEKITSGQADVTPPVDACTHAGVAKMLIRDSKKVSSNDLKEALSGKTLVGLQSRQIKEALFMKRVHLGMEPLSEQALTQVLEEREIARHEYMVKIGEERLEEDFSAEQLKLSSRRLIRDAGQAPEGTPSFQFYTSFNWEQRERLFRLFQQAARKVVIQCRADWRLVALKKLKESVKNPTSARKVEDKKTCDLEISPQRVCPSSFPFFSNEDDPLTLINLVAMPVDPIDVTVTTQIPFFKLQVPQYYKLMGYKPISAWEAYTSYIPTTLARPLRTAAPMFSKDKQVGAQLLKTVDPKAVEDELLDNEEEDVDVCLSFTAPEELLRPLPANPLRIFNPAPGLQTYKPAPKYLESSLEFHCCPLPRDPESNLCSMRTQTQKKVQEDLIPGFSTWKNFDPIPPKARSNYPPLTRIDYNTDILPLEPPLPLAGLPDYPTSLLETGHETSGTQVTPEKIGAAFLSGEGMGNLATAITSRHPRERQLEATHRSEFNQMGERVMARLKQLGSTPSRPAQSPTVENRQKKQ